MTKLENGHYEHKSWRIVHEEGPDGMLYCLCPPDAANDSEFIWATKTLKEAKAFINGNPVDVIRRAIEYLTKGQKR